MTLCRCGMSADEALVQAVRVWPRNLLTGSADVLWMPKLKRSNPPLPPIENRFFAFDGFLGRRKRCRRGKDRIPQNDEKTLGSSISGRLPVKMKARRLFSNDVSFFSTVERNACRRFAGECSLFVLFKSLFENCRACLHPAGQMLDGFHLSF